MVQQGASPEPASAAQTVLAGGVVCWRTARGRDPAEPEQGLEVVLVHRPRYDDWSLPKGKLEAGETLPECAIRETTEETGVEVVLGHPLPSVQYPLPDGRTKLVRYWAGAAVGSRPVSASPAEIDRTSWLPLERARALLSHESDRMQLQALADLARAGTLASRPFLVIRHVTARPRDGWARADADRPLVGSGHRQALALAALLQCWRPQSLLSSPWRRCLETVGPYVASSGARLRTKGGLSEDGFRRDPAKAGRHTERLLGKDHAAALCTHRPVLPSVLESVRAHATAEAGKLIPDTEPYLAPGEVLVAHTVSRSGRPTVVAVERHVAPR